MSKNNNNKSKEKIMTPEIIEPKIETQESKEPATKDIVDKGITSNIVDDSINGDIIETQEIINEAINTPDGEETQESKEPEIEESSSPIISVDCDNFYISLGYNIPEKNDLIFKRLKSIGITYSVVNDNIMVGPFIDETTANETRKLLQRKGLNCIIIKN